MTTTLLPEQQFILYQFDNGFDSNYYIFNKVELEVTGNNTLKTAYDDSFDFDGASKVNFGERNKKTAQSITVNFLVNSSDYFTPIYVDQVFNSKEKKLFWIFLDDHNFFRVFFQPNVDPVKTPNVEYKSQERLGQYSKIKTVQFAGLTPFLYECKPNVAYFNKDAIVGYQPRTNDGIARTNQIVTNQGLNFAAVPLSSLTNDDKLSLFVTPNQPDNAIVYTDKFFDLSSMYVDNSEAVINTTLTDNSSATFQLTDFFRDTTAENNVYIIELGQLLEGESLKITNTGNNTDLVINWLDSTASPANITYNSVKNKLYDPATKEEIDGSKYSVYPLSKKLYFTPLATRNMTISVTNELLQLQKTTGSNLTVKIEALKTYHPN